MIAILGSGFGLYGYLPALLQLNERVLLPERYRKRMQDRDDIRQFIDAIDWQADEQEALDKATGVVIAKRPTDQPYWVSECLKRNKIARVILEKPLAPTPETAELLINQLESCGKAFRIGYNFRYTEWFPQLLQWQESQSDGSIEIDWQFRAHHFTNNLNNWKRNELEGGGVIGFFGIHLLAMLAELGYDRITSSEVSGKLGESEKWTATIAGPRLSECHISVDSNSNNSRFSIHSPQDHQDISINLADVFESSVKQSDQTADRRIQLLKKFCREILDDDQLYFPWYRQSIELWNQAHNLAQSQKSHPA